MIITWMSDKKPVYALYGLLNSSTGHLLFYLKRAVI